MYKTISVFVLSAVALMLLVSAGFVDNADAITTTLRKRSNIPKEPSIENGRRRALSKLSLDPHLAPEVFPVDNPFNITEAEAVRRGIQVIPVDNEHWDALVSSTGLVDEPSHANSSGSQLARREVNPPDPRDWCTPNRSPAQCTFGAWCHSNSNRDTPNRAWVFLNSCELAGDLHPWQWGTWMNIYSRLPWVTVFYINTSRYPILKYAGRNWDGWSDGWELYYPVNGLRSTFYYRRYFDCS